MTEYILSQIAYYNGNWKNYCNQLLKLEQVFSELPPKERKQQRR